VTGGAHAGRHTELAGAYARTIYRVFPPRHAPIDLRPGRACAALDQLLARHGAREWVFLTAWNPASVALPRWRNERRQRQLRRFLRARGCVMWPACGIPAAGDWRAEASLFLPGTSQVLGLRMARRFGQNAILAGRRRQRAQLLWLAPTRCGRLTA
jgi:hypothetical protein